LYSSRMASHKISRFDDIMGITGFKKVIAMRCDDKNEGKTQKTSLGMSGGMHMNLCILTDGGKR
jgi:hypothetical protein